MKADVWYLGAVLLDLFYFEDHLDPCAPSKPKLVKADATINELILQMLDSKPSNRPTMKDVCELLNETYSDQKHSDAC